MSGELRQTRKLAGSKEKNGGAGSPALTSLDKILAKIQGKIIGEAGKCRLAGYLSLHLRAFVGKRPRKSGQINSEDRRPDQGTRVK
jgi:hypothetical protein